VQANRQQNAGHAAIQFQTATHRNMSGFGQRHRKSPTRNSGLPHLLILRAAKVTPAALTSIGPLVLVVGLLGRDSWVFVSRVRTAVFAGQRHVAMRLPAGMLVVRTTPQHPVGQQHDSSQEGQKTVQDTPPHTSIGCSILGSYPKSVNFERAAEDGLPGCRTDNPVRRQTDGQDCPSYGQGVFCRSPCVSSVGRSRSAARPVARGAGGVENPRHALSPRATETVFRIRAPNNSCGQRHLAWFLCPHESSRARMRRTCAQLLPRDVSHPPEARRPQRRQAFVSQSGRRRHMGSR